LTRLSTLAINGDNAVTIAAAGGIGLVLQAMKAHKEIANVQETAFRALGTRCRAVDNLKSLAGDGLATTEAKTKARVAVTRLLVNNGLKAKHKVEAKDLTRDNADNAVTIAAAVGIEAILTDHTWDNCGKYIDKNEHAPQHNSSGITQLKAARKRAADHSKGPHPLAPVAVCCLLHLLLILRVFALIRVLAPRGSRSLLTRKCQERLPAKSE
jgi:hypothetical protein